MKQKLILMILFFTFLLVNSCSKKDDSSAAVDQNTVVENQQNNAVQEVKAEAEEEEVPETEIGRLIYKRFENLRLVGYREGNFTNSGETEILAYYQNKSVRKGDPIFYNTPEDIYVFIIKNNKIIKEYKCEHGNSVSYNENKDSMILFNQDIIEHNELKFGEWDGYTFVYDYNENGLDEILIFDNGPEHFLPYIMEFHDGKMKTVLNVHDEKFFDNNVKGILETISDKNGKYIEIYGVPYRELTYPVSWERYIWDDNEKMYLLYEIGRKSAFDKNGSTELSKNLNKKDYEIYNGN